MPARARFPVLDFLPSSFLGNEVDVSQKVKSTTTFPKKFMVWQAISEDGRASEPFISESSMNQFLYAGQCIPRLVRFIESLGVQDKPVMF